jgi:CRP-like cAMP-binding protein
MVLQNSTRRRQLDHLASVPMFRDCGPKQLDLIARLADSVAVEAGEVLAREGRVGRELFVILSGTAIVTRQGSQVAALRTGDYFGELALLDPAPRNATVTAETPLDVLIIGPREFEAMLTEVPGLRWALLGGMARRLHVLDVSGGSIGDAALNTPLPSPPSEDPPV